MSEKTNQRSKKDVAKEAKEAEKKIQQAMIGQILSMTASLPAKWVLNGSVQSAREFKEAAHKARKHATGGVLRFPPHKPTSPTLPAFT